MRSVIGVLILFCLLSHSLADDSGFSGWMHASEFRDYCATRARDEYPVVVEAKALLGDGVVFRALYVSVPSDDFQYEFEYGASDREFRKRHADLTKRGFVLIHHQQVMLIVGPSHQATWVRRQQDR